MKALLIFILSAFTPIVFAQSNNYGTRILRTWEWRLISVTQGILDPGRRYTGYVGAHWNEETFDKTVESEGIYSAFVKETARLTGLPIELVDHETSFLKEAPEEITTVLALGHLWEQNSKTTPFVSTSSKGEGAAWHSGFRIAFTYMIDGRQPDRDDPSVMIVSRPENSFSMVNALRIRKNHVPIVEQAEEVVLYERTNPDQHLRDIPERVRIVADWIKQTQFFEIQELIEENRFKKDNFFRAKSWADFMNKVTISDQSVGDLGMYLLNADRGSPGFFVGKEAEQLVYNHIKPNEIIQAYLYDRNRNPIRSHSKQTDCVKTVNFPIRILAD